MKLARNLFFTDIDFCKPKVIQGLNLNLNLCLLFFKEVHRYLTTY